MTTILRGPLAGYAPAPPLGTTGQILAKASDDDGDFEWINAQIIISQTEAELAAQISPANTRFQAGDIRRYGALIDGITDDSSAWNQACSAAKSGRQPVIHPGGISLIGSTVDVPDIVRLSIIGVGQASVIKRADGQTPTNNNPLFDLSNLAGTAARVFLHGFHVEDNATGNPTSTLIALQHSGTFNFFPVDTFGFSLVQASNISCNDPVADFLGLRGTSTQCYGDIVCTNIQSSGRTRFRADITITGSYDRAAISNCVLDRFEVETNSINTALKHEITISNVICRDSFDFYCKGAVDAGILPKATINNLIVTGFVFFGEYDCTATGVRFSTDDSVRFLRGKYRFDGFSWFTGINGESYPDTNGLWTATANPPLLLEFSNGEFDCHAAAPVLYHYDDNNGFGASSEHVKFHNVKFKNSAVRSARIRSGVFKFYNCEHSYSNASGGAILQGTTNNTGVTNRVEIFNNVLENTVGYIYEPGTTGNEVAIYMGGNRSGTLGQIVYLTRYDRIVSPRGSGSVLNFHQVDNEQEAAAEPTTGEWLRGQFVHNTASSAASVCGWVCTVSGSETGAKTGSAGSVFGTLSLD